ncbi:MAG: F0F1 ATP synthase subunit A [Bacillota bacterium]|nr:F0F1 ATP synthase subunit A [Bacillota bacterium]
MKETDGQGFSLGRVEEALNVWGFPDRPWHLGTVLGHPVDLNPRTMVFTWVTMAVVLLLGWLAARGADVRRPGRVAALFELAWDLVRGLVRESMDPAKGRGLTMVMMTCLVFITVANLLGIVPAMFAPTADHQTTFALAGITFVLTQAYGLRYHGLGYFGRFLKPFPVLLPLRLIEELSRPLTLAFRLFGNMQGKEIMIFALLGLITGTAEIAGGFLASVAWLAFSVFISFIQAFVFTVLSIAYIAMAVEDD